MLRKVLLLVMVSVCLMAFGQTGAGGSTEGQPTNPVQTVITTPAYPQVPLGNGLGWSGGTVGYYGEGPAGGALLNTPTASFDSPIPTAGISLAGRTGISDLNPTAVQSTASNSTLVYTNVGPEVAASASPATAAVSSSATTKDFGPSFFSNQIGENYTGMSLAQVADHYRALQSPTGLRTYTNADVHPARSAADEENRLLAANRPSALPQGNTSAPQVASSQTSTSTPEAATQSSPEEAQTQSGNATKLPASASQLPLLALAGLISIGLGLLLKGTRHRLPKLP